MPEVTAPPRWRRLDVLLVVGAVLALAMVAVYVLALGDVLGATP